MATPHERLGALFLEAVELEPTERDAFIARVRTDDHELAAKLIAMLAADADVATALRDNDDTATARTVAGSPGGSLRDSVPVIPGFRVTGRLGDGGMGTVYAGQQESPRRPVAIKVLAARSPDARIRFVAESEIMARLDHPGIARVLGAGEVDGELWLAMERVDGVTFDRVDRPLRERLELFAKLCDAVHHAHQKGVIHRDLKPSNVMVREDGRVAVLDFGVARLVEDGSNNTRAGELIGTPVYMSPEQARLRPDEVDASSDVYSLGVMFYEMCSGALPYDVRGLPLQAVMLKIVDDEPRRLGQRDPALRGNLEAIAASALAKRPADRYRSAAALADDVRRHLAGHAVLARTPSFAEQVVRFARRRPATAAVTVAIALATLGFAVIVTVLWFDAKRARDELSVRNDQSLLREARAEVAHDPEAALLAIGGLSKRADPWRARAIADEAKGRGIAQTTVHAHSAEVHAIEIVGDRVITAGFDGRVRLWTELAGTPRELLVAQTPIHLARPRPDGAAVAIAGEDGLLRVVDLDGRVLAELSGHAGHVKRALWSPDGAWLATGDDHGGVRLWANGQAPARSLPAGTAEIESLAVAANGVVAAGDIKGNLWRWSGEARREIVAGHGSIVGVWTDGDAVAAVTADGHLLRTRGDEPVVMTELGASCRHAAFVADGSAVVIGTRDGAVLRVEGGRIEHLGQLAGHVRVALSRDAQKIAAAGDGGDVEVWDRTTGRVVRLHGHDDRVRVFEFARGGKVLLTGDDEGIVRQWQLDAIPPTVLAGDGAIERFAVDGERIVAADRGGGLWAWTRAGARRSLGVAKGALTAFAAIRGGAVVGTANGEVIALGDSPTTHAIDGPVTAIATHDATCAAASASAITLFEPDLTIATAGTEVMTFEPHGRWLAAAGKDGVVRVWRVGEPTPFVELPGASANTRYLALAGDRLVAGGDDGKVRIWDRLEPSAQRVVAEHTGGVTALAANASWIVSAGRDHRIVRAGVAGGSQSVTIHNAIASLAVAPDGSVLATTQQRELVRWPARVASATTTDDGVLAVAYLAGAVPHWAAALADGAIALWEL